MDKKLKFQQTSTKGTASETKKIQDVVTSKLFPKSSHKREPTGASSNSKYDQKKSNAQKAKNFDKRPKPKGHYYGGSKENTKVVEDESSELGSVMVQGSKKQNLNHLLNFHYAPRDTQSGRWNYGRTNTYNRNTNRWLPATQRHRYNKEEFLQANCQFVVTANCDYTAYLADPDVLVDWKLIEQVRVHSADKLSCPICLCPPVAAKMTRCGHVYCWPCILHYLALSDKQWRKCPICYESIHKTDIKSIVEITQDTLNTGDNIQLRLMRRERGSLIAEPVTDIKASAPTKFFSVAESLTHQVFSKLLLANITDILDIIEAERAQLKVELLEDPNSPENCFIEQAINELALREQELLQINDPLLDTQCKNETLENVTEDEVGSMKQSDIEKIFTSNAEITLRMETDEAGQLNPPKFYYFYQANDGQNVYLHAMNVKMLEMQYGSLEQCPQIVSGKLIEKEAGSLTNDLRRRMRCLCHLPVTCQFEIAEIELLPPFVSEEVIGHFAGQIQSRKKNRERREREERKREKKIAEEENKRMGKYPTPNVHIESHRHFPEFHPESFTAEINSPSESAEASSLSSSPSTSTFEEIASKEENRGEWPISDQTPSFAQMLRTKGSRMTSSISWPAATRSRQTEVEDEDPELQEYASPPMYNQSLGDALAEALEKSQLLTREGGTKEVTSRKKKKKTKATVLFATNMARAS